MRLAWARPSSSARELRAKATWAEIKLWSALRKKQIGGFRFRRQFSLGPYFADFVCFPARLIVEVDGSQHAEAAAMAYDKRRTAWFEREGFCVLRFMNRDVLTDLDHVVSRISEVAAMRAAEKGASPRTTGPPPISGP